MLEPKDVELLSERFKASQIGFLTYGDHRPYVDELAVTTRLDKVDSSWSLKHIATYHRDNQVISIVELTIKGVTRSGTGMQDILLDKKGENEINEPEKAAATDALKRAARMFGVGRYLLAAPDWVQSKEALEKWYKQVDDARANKAENEPTEPSTPAQPKPDTTPNRNGKGDNADAPRWWKSVAGNKELGALAGSPERLAALLKAALAEGKIKPDDTVQWALDFARELTAQNEDIPF